MSQTAQTYETDKNVSQHFVAQQEGQSLKTHPGQHRYDKQSIAAGAHSILFVNANYRNLYYFQNHYYTRFMSLMDVTKQNKEAEHPGRRNKYPAVK